MKKFSIRIEVDLDAVSADEAERLTQIYLRELPRMENLSYRKGSLYNLTDKRMVREDMR